MSALWKDEFIKKYVYRFCFLGTSMSTDIPQIVDGTITVMSKDVKMRMISSRIPPKSSSYSQKDVFDK